jgi:hypothetical protein
VLFEQIGAVPLVQLVHPPGDDVDPGHQCLNVADDLAGDSTIPRDDPEDVSVGTALLVEAHGREQHPFVVRAGGQRAQPTDGGAAHVGHVDERAPEPADAPAGEDRAQHHDVVGMDAAPERVIGGVDIATTHVVERHVRDDCLQPAPEAGTVHDAGGRRLGHQLAPGIEQRPGGVGPFLNVGAVRSTHHHNARLFDGHRHGVAYHLCNNGGRAVGRQLLCDHRAI